MTQRRLMNRRGMLRLGTAAAATPLAFTALPATSAQAAPLSVRGADLSTVLKAEHLGAVWRYANGTQGDVLQILRQGGTNWVRLKVWVNSADGYHGRDEILTMARRVHAAGMSLLVDFHYSDTWADPGKQYKPAAWNSLSGSALQQALADHTRDILGSLVAQGTPAAMAQLGNEIHNGMLWPNGSTDNWDSLGSLLRAAVSAARAASPSTRIALHLAEGGDNGLYRWWFDNAVRRGVSFDVIAASFYGYWHGTLSELRYNLNDVSARYGKDVLVMETAYPFRLGSEDSTGDIIDRQSELVSGYPATPQGQVAWMRDICAVVAGVPNGRGLGLVYWEPAWTATPGNGWDEMSPSSGNAWENQAWFDYDSRLLPAATWPATAYGR
ncbi:glycoside hydrolase family 53 protein [Streptomyces litchfieldiae]|uniref:Arabinogalactan endo-beta-1,4-galactanase n=1 Tax=Streptomyces litchfieldiae TaxID=3075543 RepID=A0ABU2MLC3_9ACTN|nr:arabinogalactan endo-1,4-beta-galactosidase [Streptomyces sp. DSM 44938]MDT0342412.1 arabinogalactan endo-1,4-beta-galactosidase [Streptomyces sp. DSM 44938]